MIPFLEHTFNQLELQREEFTSWVTQAPQHALHQKPAPDKWSAAQLLYHLVTVDQQVLININKRVSSGKALRPMRLSTKLRSSLLNFLLKLPIKFKAPEAVAFVPEEVLVPEVIEQWAENRASLQAFLTSFPEEQLKKEIFFHPRSGMITLPQTLTFLIEHTEHHRRQLKDLLS